MKKSKYSPKKYENARKKVFGMGKKMDAMHKKMMKEDMGKV